MSDISGGGIVCRDARSLDRIAVLKKHPVRTIITSPPYLDTHNYGEPGQIGYGQTRESYLADLRQIFERCLKLSTDDSTMWLVVGAIRRSGKLIQLPEILTSLAEEVGWIPREQITWAKEKSLPWTKPGELRDVTEQVILFSKSDSFVFELRDLLSPTPRTPWWKRYPERYSPQGRKPTNLWNIQIPTQGAWRDGPTHLCPFPHELTYRLISLTSELGDVVLDPFAGIGSVPAMATAMGRIGYGLELSQRYVDAYPETLKRTREWYNQKKIEVENSEMRRDTFFNTIIALRLLKFGKLIGSHLVDHRHPIEWIHVTRSQQQADEKHKIVVGHFEVKLPQLKQQSEILESLKEISKTRPLSKFGVQPVFSLTDTERSPPPTYWYKTGKFWAKPVSLKPMSPEFHLSSDFMPSILEVSEMKDDSELPDDDASSAIQFEEQQARFFDVNLY